MLFHYLVLTGSWYSSKYFRPPEELAFTAQRSSNAERTSRLTHFERKTQFFPYHTREQLPVRPQRRQKERTSTALWALKGHESTHYYASDRTTTKSSDFFRAFHSYCKSKGGKASLLGHYVLSCFEWACTHKAHKTPKRY